MPYMLTNEVRLQSLYTHAFVLMLHEQCDAVFPRYWPTEAEALDAILACLGAPL